MFQYFISVVCFEFTKIHSDLTVHYTLTKILMGMEILPVEDEEIIVIGTRPAISRMFSPICRNMEIPQTHRFSERKLDHNWQFYGQHYSSYYQP